MHFICLSYKVNNGHHHLGQTCFSHPQKQTKSANCYKQQSIRYAICNDARYTPTNTRHTEHTAKVGFGPETSALNSLQTLLAVCVQYITSDADQLEQAEAPLYEILNCFNEETLPLTKFVQNALTIAQNNPALLNAISTNEGLRTQLVDVALTPCAKVLEDVGYEDTEASQTLASLKALLQTCVQYVTASEETLAKATPPLLEILAYFTADSEEKRPPLTNFVQNALTIAQNNPGLLNAISTNEGLRTAGRCCTNTMRKGTRRRWL